MARVRRNALFRSIVGLLLTLPALAQTISLNVTPDRERIYLGESFNLHVTVNGADSNLSTPDLSGLAAAAQVSFLGSQSQSRRSISIINGKFTQESLLGRTFVFQIRPDREGPFPTGPVTMTHEGQTVTASGRPVNVTGLSRQSFVQGEITASTTAALVDEPFRIKLDLAIAPLPTPYDDVEPIHASQPPRLSADFLNIADIKGLRQPDLNAILSELARNASERTPSFLINDYQRSGMDMGNPFDFDFGFGPRPIRFRFQPERRLINTTNYWVYALTLDYTPQDEGDYTFGPLTFKGPVLTGVSPDRRGIFSEIFAVAPAVTVRVTPPPEKGRPEWFVGSVGRDLKAKASLDTPLCKVGDPLTLTLDITGAISLSNLRPPLLALQSGLNQDFRIYDDSVTTATIENGKRFTWRLRPINAGTLEFPPIRLAYYDTAAKSYVTVTTDPIPIQARPTTQIVSDLPNTPDAAGATLSLRSSESSLPAAIAVTLTTTPLLPPAVLLWPLLLAGPAIFLLALALRTIWRRRRTLSLSWRRGRAANRACRALSRDATPATVAAALRAYLSERLNTSGQALTPPEAADILRRRNIPEDLAAAWQTALARLDADIYKPLSADSAHAGHQPIAVTLVNDTEKALSQRPTAAKAILPVILLMLLTSAYSTRVENVSPPSDSIQYSVFSVQTSTLKRLLLNVPLKRLTGGRCAVNAATTLRRQADHRLATASSTPTIQVQRPALTPDHGHASGRDTFAWEEANSRLAGAHTAPDFHQAAMAYNRMVQNGETSGALFFNLGTALLLSGDGHNAIAALARAERRAGSSPATRTNLRLAYGLIDSIAPDFSPQALPTPAPQLWTHTAFFWHFDSPCRHRVATALVGWTLLCLALTLRLFRPIMAKPFIYAALLLTIIFGASAAISLVQEYHDSHTWSIHSPVTPDTSLP